MLACKRNQSNLQLVLGPNVSQSRYGTDRLYPVASYLPLHTAEWDALWSSTQLIYVLPPLIEGPFRPQLTGAQMPSVGQLLGQHKKLPLS